MQNKAPISSPVSIEFDDLLQARYLARGLSLRNRNIKATQGGAFYSKFKGRGMEFDEVRPYVDGDDIRSLDWKVTARTNRPHTKVYREERERPVQIWLDLRANMQFATRHCYKSVWAAQAAALISWSAMDNRDRVGGMVFSEYEHRELKPRLGSKAVLPLLKNFAEHPVWHEETTQQPVQDRDAFEHAVSRLRRVTKPGSLVFMLSDFRGWNAQVESTLFQLARHNELFLMFCYDPFEQELPDRGLYKVSDGNQEIILNAGSHSQKTEHRNRFEKRFQHLKAISRLRGVNFVACNTVDDPLPVLQRAFGQQVI